MARWIAVCLVVLVALSISTAQPAAKDKPGIEATVEENKQWVWTLPASGEVRLPDLLALYAKCRDVLILCDEKKLQGTASFVGAEARQLRGEEIDLFVSNCLGEYRLALAAVGSNQYSVMPAAEALTRGRSITEAELPEVPGWEWIVLIYQPRCIEENSLRGALQGLVTRQGGAINPVAGGGLLICDRADRVREVHKAAVTLDEGLKPETRSYDLPEGVKPDDAIKALRELFGTDQKYRYYAPSFARGTSEKHLVVRGTKELQADAEKALKVMK